MTARVDATAQLVIFLAYFTYSFWVLFCLISLFRIRVAWKKIWDYTGYCLDQASWADLKAELGKKLDGRNLEKNKEHVHNVLGKLRKHDLYRTISQYNYELPNLLNCLREADDVQKFELVRKDILTSFSHVNWSIFDQFKATCASISFPISNVLVWFLVTVLLRKWE